MGEEWHVTPLDDVDLVTEAADMMSVFAAQRFERIDGMRVRALEDAGRYGGAVAAVVERSLRLELATALRITEHAAGDLMALAEALVHRYPAALDALGHADITERHAQILAAQLDEVEPDVRERVLGRAVDLAEELPVGSFRRALRRLIERAGAASLAARQEAALEQRRVVVEPVADGMAWLHAFVPAVEAFAIHSRLTVIAKTLTAQADEQRTLDQARTDVLCDLLIDGDTRALPPEARGIRATVAVTVPVLALMGADDAADEGVPVPAIVDGIGPIPVGRARELCGDAEGWMRVLTHPETGAVLSVGRDRYRPPPELRRLVRWRAETCMAPGCGIPAARCEIDHTVAWEHGGTTSLDNLAPLCKGHHTVKHHGGWTLKQYAGSGGAVEWTSPSGRRYIVQPTRATPVFAPSREGSAGPPDAPF